MCVQSRNNLLCRGPALGGWREDVLEADSENEEPTVQPGLGSRANLQENMHASYFRGIGGKRMPLDIVNAVLSELGPSVLQMSRAKAQKEGLLKKVGVSQEERAAREEEHRKTIMELAKEFKKGKALDKRVAEALEGLGLATEPVGVSRIQEYSVARKRPLTRDSEREDNATHRADTLQREKRRKENVTLLGSDGKEVNVEETDLTEADLEGQAEELERLERTKKGGGKNVVVESEEEMEGEEESMYERLYEQLEKEEREKKKREEQKKGGKDYGGGEGDEAGEESGEEEEGGDGEERETERGEEEVYHHYDHITRDRAQEEVRGKNAGRFSSEWGLARLKGDDAAKCVGVAKGYACQRLLNEGVQPGEAGNIVLMK